MRHSVQLDKYLYYVCMYVYKIPNVFVLSVAQSVIFLI